MKRIAVVGSGIGAIAGAYDLLKAGFEVSLFEKGSYFGGHTHTHSFDLNEHHYTVDTGFLVHNDRTYPNLIKFFEELGLKSYPSEMSFSVRLEQENLEWCGTNLSTVFCQRKNLLSPRFYRFLREIIRFNKKSDQFLLEASRNLELTLGDLLKKYRFSEDFSHWYLLPMGGCIWSSPMNEMLKFPAHTFLRFCKNHGLLQITDRPQWKTLVGGCNTYTNKVVELLPHKFLNEGVVGVEPLGKGVRVVTEKRVEEFDGVLFGCHAPQTLEIVKGIDHEVDEILSQFHYQRNIAYLHTDSSQLPMNRSAWAAWNYRSQSQEDYRRAVSVSYYINMLQPLPKHTPIIVTLNPFEEIDSNKIIKKLGYEHPLFDKPAIVAQEKIPTIQGRHGFYFSGAWMRYGFHEDGIWAAKMAVKKLKKDFQVFPKKYSSHSFDHAIL